VAVNLALYKFSLKTSPPSPFNPNLKEAIPEKLSFSPLQASKEWDQGVVYAQSQNLARTVCSSFLHGARGADHMKLAYGATCQHDDSDGMYVHSYYLPRLISFLTRQAFCERVKKEFEGIANVDIIVRDEGRILLSEMKDEIYSYCCSMGRGKEHGMTFKTKHFWSWS